MNNPRQQPPAQSSNQNDRLPPHNVELERALLGAILLNNRAFDHVVDLLMPEHFTEAVNGRLFAVISTMINQGAPVNAVTLKNYVANDELVNQAGGMKYIVSLSTSMVTVINAREYGKLIYGLHLRRELIGAGEDLINAAYDPMAEESADAVLEQHEERLFQLASTTTHRSRMVDIRGAVEEALVQAVAAHKLDGAVVGVPTGLVDLDRKLGGLHPSDLVILAGRPSMGKTSLAQAIALSAARFFQATDRPEYRGRHVVFFSLEMSAGQIGLRIMSGIAGIDSNLIRSGRLKDDDFNTLNEVSVGLEGLPLHIDDTAGATVNAIRTRARRLARKAGSAGVGLIIVDHLQHVATAGQRRESNRSVELGDITKGLKALAKDLDCPVLALSQLSRALEQREDKRPQLSDLRESGNIEQDADTVLFCYREQYYLERNYPQQRPEENLERFSDRLGKYNARLEASHNMAEVIIGKQRQGPIGAVQLQFNATLTLFSSLEKRLPDDGPVEDFEAPVTVPAAPAKQANLGV